eukprot:TRINITY_DN28746_c0_g1_i2.p1 TRINITY_DN28746_c0_g1~~TRINITY_DN28746_c0_g1_i2.p1  ORF type:complete len:990 (+),score=306.33 TRINITY_DN28746_c0_g1_i2:431-2971(+)
MPPPASRLVDADHGRLRVQCAQTLTRLLSLCTDEDVSVDTEQRTVASLCLSTIKEAGFVSLALAALAPDPQTAASDAVRVALAESLFVAVMRVRGAARVLASAGGAEVLTETLFADGSEMVRNYSAAILRVLAEHSPDDFAELELVDRALSRIRFEQSKYVVILLLEIVALLFGAFPDTFLSRSHVGSTLVEDLQEATLGLLRTDPTDDVVTAVVRLLETLFVLEGCSGGRSVALTASVLADDGWKPLLSRDPHQSPEAKTLKVRALRRLVQGCTTPLLCDELHSAFTRFFPSLSLLINSDHGQGPPTELARELALCFSVILAKHPRSREFVIETLGGYPVWIAQLRRRLLASLDAPPRVMNSVFIIDAAPAWLNDVRQHAGVDWGDRGGIAIAVANMFAEQERRLAAAGTRVIDRVFAMQEETTEAPPRTLSPCDQKARLTQAVLAHAVRVGLTPAGSDEADDVVGMPLSPSGTGLVGDVLRGLAVHSPPRAATPGRAQRRKAPARRTRSQSVGTRRAVPSGRAAIDTAILTYLPMKWGEYYDKRNRPIVRHFPSPAGPRVRGGRPFVQQTTQSMSLQSWEAADVEPGDLFGFSIPFDELSVERVQRDIDRLHKHRVRMRKGSLTTPASRRGRRWFFSDMIANILPRLEQVLEQLRDTVGAHGKDGMLFYLNIVKLMEQKSSAAGGGDLLRSEVVTLCGTMYPDTIHGGNVLFTLDRIAEYFAERENKGETQMADHLKGIEREIRNIEEAAARGVAGSDDEKAGRGRSGSASTDSVDAAPLPRHDDPHGQPDWETDSDHGDRPTMVHVRAAAHNYAHTGEPHPRHGRGAAPLRYDDGGSESTLSF